MSGHESTQEDIQLIEDVLSVSQNESPGSLEIRVLRKLPGGARKREILLFSPKAQLAIHSAFQKLKS